MLVTRTTATLDGRSRPIVVIRSWLPLLAIFDDHHFSTQMPSGVRPTPSVGRLESGSFREITISQSIGAMLQTASAGQIATNQVVLLLKLILAITPGFRTWAFRCVPSMIDSLNLEVLYPA